MKNLHPSSSDSFKCPKIVNLTRYKTQKSRKSPRLETDSIERILFTCCLPCCPAASRSCRRGPGSQRCPGPVASWGIVCGPCGGTAEGSEGPRGSQTPRLPAGSYLRGERGVFRYLDFTEGSQCDTMMSEIHAWKQARKQEVRE